MKALLATMKTIESMKSWITLLFLLSLISWQSCCAQPTPPLEGSRGPKSKLRTVLNVELLTSPTTTLEAQRWGSVFQKQGVEVRTRSAESAKPEVRESKQGTVRTVTIIAVLEPNGSLVVPGRRFTQDRQPALADWLVELKTFGAQGRPDGKPAYGLSKPQFDELFKLLEQPVTKSAQRLPFDEALEAVSIPRGLAMRLNAEASERLQKLPREWKFDLELKGLSRGTGIAILLANAGLAFRPSRTPDEELELVIVPLDEPGTWPVGWSLDRPPLKAVPKLVELVPIEVAETSLPVFFARVSRECEIPILIDHVRIAARGVTLSDTMFEQIPKRTMWSLVLQNSTSPHHLLREILLDEAGRPFVWITTDDPRKQNERAKQREVLIERQTKASGK